MLRSFLWDSGLAQRLAGMFSMVGQMRVGGVTCLLVAQGGRVQGSAG